MGSIYKRGRVWYYDLRVKGRRVRRRVGPSKKIAELALRDAEVRIARDEFGFNKNDISIEKYFTLFRDYSQATHRPATTERYRAVMDHFLDFLTEYPNVNYVSEITTELIDRYKVHRRGSWVNGNGHPVASEVHLTPKTHKGARAHTVNFELDTLRLLLNLAIKWGYMKENPSKGVVRLKVEDAKPVRFLSKEECQRFLEATPPELFPVYFTFLKTGMRKAELENLTWADVDLRRRRLLIRRKPDWQPKTGEREIPISDELLEVLGNLRKKAKKMSGSDYVFAIKTSGRSHNRVRDELIKIAQKAELSDLTKVHTLRHTFASHLIMNGVDLPTVKKLMGHSDIETTMIYAHLAPDHLADAVNKLKF